MLLRTAAAFLFTIFLSMPSSAFVPEMVHDKAIFAGGCFWCMQPPFDKTDGVILTTVGYTGGTIENPTYEQVTGGSTGHYEAIEIVYDDKKVSYEQLLDIFWKNIDPLNAQGQFCDLGSQYHSAIFYVTPEQKEAAEKSKKALEEKLQRTFETKILPKAEFYAAEEYHQKYYLKNPVRYGVYKQQCKRDKRLEEVWGGN